MTSKTRFRIKIAKHLFREPQYVNSITKKRVESNSISVSENFLSWAKRETAEKYLTKIEELGYETAEIEEYQPCS